MELNKERGPIYSRYDRDRPGNYSAVIDYAAPPRSREEIQFMLAHKITPNQAEPNDMLPGSQEGTSALATFMQTLLAQRAADQLASNRSMAKQDVSWSGQRGRAPQTEAQKRMALIGVVIWAIFILLAMLMGIFGR